MQQHVKQGFAVSRVRELVGMVVVGEGNPLCPEPLGAGFQEFRLGQRLIPVVHLTARTGGGGDPRLQAVPHAAVQIVPQRVVGDVGTGASQPQGGQQPAHLGTGYAVVAGKLHPGIAGLCRDFHPLAQGRHLPQGIKL